MAAENSTKTWIFHHSNLPCQEKKHIVHAQEYFKKINSHLPLDYLNGIPFKKDNQEITAPKYESEFIRHLFTEHWRRKSYN